MYFRFIPRRLFSLDNDGRFHWRLYLLGICFRLKRRVPLPAPPNKWAKYKNLPIHSNRIVLRSVQDGYAGNAKYVAEEIMRRGLPYELVWIMTRHGLPFLSSFPPNIKLVMENTEDAYIAEATAKVSVDECMRAMFRGYVRPKDQYRMFIWHGHINKKVCSHTQSYGGFYQSLWWTYDPPNYVLCESRWEERIMKSICRNRGKYTITGYPRYDALISPEQENIRKRIRDQLGIPQQKKVLLYAPTWRSSFDLNSSIWDYTEALHACAERFGGDWVLTLRAHNLVYGARHQFKTGQSIYEASSVADTQELLIAVDALISDYSGILTDFYLTGKPTWIFAPDLKEYNDSIPGLYFPIHVHPASVAEDITSLIYNIRNFDESSFHSKVNKYLKDWGILADGHSSKRVVDMIAELAPLSSFGTVAETRFNN